MAEQYTNNELSNEKKKSVKYINISGQMWPLIHTLPFYTAAVLKLILNSNHF